MKNYLKPLIFSLCFCLLLCGCGESSQVQSESSTSSGTVSVDTSFAQTSGEMFTDRDYEVGYDQNACISITLNGDTAECSSDAVQITNGKILITEEATYCISGTLNDGMLIIDAPETAKLQLVFDGAHIHSKTSAALYILNADKVFITLESGSQNTLSNGGTFEPIDDNNIDAALFSKQDITLNGEGSLTVTSPAGHGIVSKDDLVITGGSYTVESASHGLSANDSVRIANAALTVRSGKDGIQAENTEDTSLGFVYIASGTLHIVSDGDGISASAYLQLEDGTFSVTSGGGAEQTVGSESAKALKAAGGILIQGGTYSISSADDAVHSNTSIAMENGTFAISTGDDGFHADETLEICGGKISIAESYEGLEALDIIISGGEIDLVASDDGLNAAGGTDSSGFGGVTGNDRFGGGGGRQPGGHGGGGGMGMGSAGNGSITITGGTLYIQASGDGIDANGTLTISGGHTTVCGPTQGDTATLDYDTSAVITGGTFIGTGASGMAQTFSDSEQGVIAVSVGNQSAGTQITLQDGDGNTVISYAPKLPFAVVILSSPELVSGETYTITVGSQSGSFTAS